MSVEGYGSALDRDTLSFKGQDLQPLEALQQPTPKVPQTLIGFAPAASRLSHCVAGSYDTVSFHGTRRGAQPLMIIPPANAGAPAAPAVPQKYVNFTYGNFNVPANETSYVCKVGGDVHWDIRALRLV